jgi:hypothetical protein
MGTARRAHLRSRERAARRAAGESAGDRHAWRGTLTIFAAMLITPADAFVIDISPGNPVVLYLQVGTGSFSGLYRSGGSPQSNPMINVVSVTVPSAALLTGADQQMTSDSAQAVSFYDGRVICNPPEQVYIGGFFRRPGKPAFQSAVLTVTVPPALISPAGDTIPFSQIRWRSNGLDAVPDGAFIAGGTQFIADFYRNTWRESCLTFYYLNEPAAAGTYEGRVTYTLTAP